MAGVARDQREAMSQSRAADENIKIIYRAAASSQSCLLVGEYFQGGRNGQYLLGKQTIPETPLLADAAELAKPGRCWPRRIAVPQ